MKYGALVIAALLVITSCGAPGQRAAETPVIRPNEVSDFEVLYRQNCSGCHGADGQGGLTVGVGNPVYLAIAGDAAIRRITADGVRGTAMPAFAQKAGGMLTDAQIDILVRGIRARWAKPGTFDNAKPPAYTAAGPGDAARGQNVFTAFCSSCHSPDGRSGRGGSIVDSAYLALVSDQHLRTVTIVGMPAFGAPDWRGDVPGKPLSEADVTDVVAWLAGQREPLSTQSHSGASNSQGGSE
ncbi:MAG TPA: cytochrome c [Bryobacteraceae bacterium]|jgi:mono/diheme cytochrome c family protein|nr:cytochrome c [Bryobacteraceae bacterium]